MGGGKTSSRTQVNAEFSGFYMVNIITRFGRGTKAGYALVVFALVAIPAAILYLSGTQPFSFVSLLLFGGVVLFFLLSRWINNIAIKACQQLLKQTEPKDQKEVAKIAQGLMDRWFNAWGHLISGLVFVASAVVLALAFGHPEWLYPAMILLGFFTGISIWVIGGTIYFWHNLSTKVIGTLTPVRALNPDRMGGFRFIADHVVTWTLIEAIRVVYVIAILMVILWEVSLPAAQTYFFIFFLAFIAIWVAGYSFLVLDLHRVFSSAKQEIAAELSSLMITVEEGVTAVAKEKKPTDTWEQIVAQINPYAQSILALKVFIDEYRHMRDWPIDLPLILKVIFAILTPFLLLIFQWSIQIVLGIPLP